MLSINFDFSENIALAMSRLSKESCHGHVQASFTSHTTSFLFNDNRRSVYEFTCSYARPGEHSMVWSFKRDFNLIILYLFKKHRFDFKNAEIVGYTDDQSTAFIIKKLLIKFASTLDLITNFTEFSPCHLYDQTAIEQVAQLLAKNFETSMSSDDIVKNLRQHIQKAVDGKGVGIRGTRTTHFDQSLVVFFKKVYGKVTW